MHALINDARMIFLLLSLLKRLIYYGKSDRLFFLVILFGFLNVFLRLIVGIILILLVGVLLYLIVLRKKLSLISSISDSSPSSSS